MQDIDTYSTVETQLLYVELYVSHFMRLKKIKICRNRRETKGKTKKKIIKKEKWKHKPWYLKNGVNDFILYDHQHLLQRLCCIIYILNQSLKELSHKQLKIRWYSPFLAISPQVTDNIHTHAHTITKFLGRKCLLCSLKSEECLFTLLKLRVLGMKWNQIPFLFVIHFLHLYFYRRW